MFLRAYLHLSYERSQTILKHIRQKVRCVEVLLLPCGVVFELWRKEKTYVRIWCGLFIEVE